MNIFVTGGSGFVGQNIIPLLIKNGHTIYALDHDNTLIFTNKSDATKSYKTKNGYCPGVGIIGNQIVFFENRNSDAKTLQ